ncbi:MAG: GTP-binding protein, partial [Planctomycetota bacterium]
MVQINFANKEIQCKIVYYGPGMSGKTTNLEVVHKKAPTNAKGDLTSIATEGDRTLFFDFMPLDLGNIAGIKTKFQLYTVPGQVYYNSTRKLVLQGVDGIVFVADSQAEKSDENIEALENLKTNLREYGRDLDSIPVVFQWNKRDLPTALPLEELQKRMNPMGAPSFEAVASTGEGVFPTLKALASLVLESINREKKDGRRTPARAA